MPLETKWHDPDCPRLPRMTAELSATACLMAQGLTNARIAAALDTSVRNVREHIQRIRRHHQTCYGREFGERALVVHLIEVGCW